MTIYILDFRTTGQTWQRRYCASYEVASNILTKLGYVEDSYRYWSHPTEKRQTVFVFGETLIK